MNNHIHAFSNPDLAQVFEKTRHFFDEYQSHLNSITSDILTLEWYLQKRGLATNFHYDVEPRSLEWFPLNGRWRLCLDNGSGPLRPLAECKASEKLEMFKHLPAFVLIAASTAQKFTAELEAN